MKRQKRIVKIKPSAMFRNAREIILKVTAGVIAAVICLFAASVLIKSFLSGSDYFRLRTVETRGVFLDQAAVNLVNNQLLGLYKGDNVFRINLKGVAGSIQRSYPDAREVVVRLIMPDKMLVNLKFSKPIALVRGQKTYPIDEDGFVLPSMDPDSLTGLTVIDGVVIRYDERRGKQNSSKNLAPVLELLKEARKSKYLTECGVVSVDAKDLSGLSFYLRSGLEIRIGYENFRDRLESLERTLKDPRLVVDRIKYIDVRFKDVVIGPK